MSANQPQLNAALSGRYTIERELGAGGMATVYLAHDVRHDRKVALKVLRPELSAILGAARFLTEIKTTANLQHPHILSLFDSGEADGTVFYVMPYIEGESLRDRIKRDHQLPVDEAVRIAREVLDALEYAHKQGIVHRDIKPENILLHGGHAMVADFGIALAASKVEGGSRMTETGMSLGTPHYMSPEQAMGEREITPRSDIYAVGCVLYEMLTAEPPFVGASAQAIFARVLTDEPRSITMQRRTVPPNVGAAVNMALQKLPADRFATAAQFAEALGKDAFVAPATRARPALRGGVPAGSVGQQALKFLPWTLAVAGIATSAWLVTHTPQPVPKPIGRFALHLTPDVASAQVGQVIALSPDGSRIVYVGGTSLGTQLYMRTLSEVTPVPIPGSRNGLSPFFSPDGQQIAFVNGTKLLKVSVGGGPTLPITEVSTTFRGGTWNEQDTILFADDRGLSVVPAAGGKPTLLAAPDSSSHTYRWPDFLPGGRTALFAINDGSVDRLGAITLASKAVRRFDVIGSNPHYVNQGFVTLAIMESSGGGVASGTLVTIPFDAKRLAVLGQPVPVSDSVQVGPSSRTAKLGVSRDGSIAFASGAVGMSSLMLVKRDGTAKDIGAEQRFYSTPRLSPDGRRVAVAVYDVGNDIWIYDIQGRTLTRLTFDKTALRPFWSHDGRRVGYERSGSKGQDLAWIPVDGSAPAESLVVAPDNQSVGFFAPNGRSMVIREQVAGGGRRRISLVNLDSANTPRPIIATQYDNFSPSLSPDGRWVAYVSDESSRNEIYVRPFPGPGGRWQVSKEGGNEPRWSPTGREIFFRAGETIMAASVQAGATFVPGEVRPLFRTTASANATFLGYDVTRDGQSFIMVQPKTASDQAVVVLLNWFDQLSAKKR